LVHQWSFFFCLKLTIGTLVIFFCLKSTIGTLLVYTVVSFDICNVARVSCNVTGNTCNITRNTCNITRLYTNGQKQSNSKNDHWCTNRHMSTQSSPNTQSQHRYVLLTISAEGSLPGKSAQVPKKATRCELLSVFTLRWKIGLHPVKVRMCIRTFVGLKYRRCIFHIKVIFGNTTVILRTFVSQLDHSIERCFIYLAKTLTHFRRRHFYKSGDV